MNKMSDFQIPYRLLDLVVYWIIMMNQDRVKGFCPDSKMEPNIPIFAQEIQMSQYLPEVNLKEIHMIFTTTNVRAGGRSENLRGHAVMQGY